MQKVKLRQHFHWTNLFPKKTHAQYNSYHIQFKFSTPLLTLNYLIILSHWRSTTVYLETYPFLQITTSWNTLFLKVRFKFYQIHNVEIGSNFVICHSELLTVLEQWTCFRSISYVYYLRLHISPHFTMQYEIVCENWGLFTFHSNSRAQGKYLCGAVRIICLIFSFTKWLKFSGNTSYILYANKQWWCLYVSCHKRFS